MPIVDSILLFTCHCRSHMRGDTVNQFIFTIFYTFLNTIIHKWRILRNEMPRMLRHIVLYDMSITTRTLF